jgi:hypothetical protein
MPAAGKASTKGRHENKKRKIVSLFFPPNEMLRVQTQCNIEKMERIAPAGGRLDESFAAWIGFDQRQRSL